MSNHTKLRQASVVIAMNGRTINVTSFHYRPFDMTFVEKRLYPHVVDQWRSYSGELYRPVDVTIWAPTLVDAQIIVARLKIALSAFASICFRCIEGYSSNYGFKSQGL